MSNFHAHDQSMLSGLLLPMPLSGWLMLWVCTGWIWQACSAQMIQWKEPKHMKRLAYSTGLARWTPTQSWRPILGHWNCSTI